MHVRLKKRTLLLEEGIRHEYVEVPFYAENTSISGNLLTISRAMTSLV